MKHTLLTTAALGCLLMGLMSGAAQAGNSTVEDALKRRPDLSTFYQGLVSTGVINELKENQSYTVFAPTNEAFAAELPASRYPCFYSAQCKPEVAEILRNHIVPGEKHVRDIGAQNTGGIMSLFTIDNQHIVASEPYRNDYAVDGHNVLSENQLAGSVLYRIDGVIVTPPEMAQFSAPESVLYVQNGLPPRVPEGDIVTITSTSPIHY